MSIFIPTRQRVILSKETVAGTPLALGSAAGILGPVTGPNANYLGSVTTEDADLGMGINTFAVVPNSGRYATLAWSEFMRADGEWAFVLMGMLGAGNDVPAGSAPVTHPGSIVAALPPTYTAYLDTGLQNEYLPFPYATGTSVVLSWSPTSAPTAAVQLTSLPPNAKSGTAPTIATRTSANAPKNAQCVYTYQSATAGTPYPTADVVSGSLSFARATDPVVTGGSDPATDIAPKGLMMTGNCDLIYRGDSANTAFNDWRLWKDQGVVGNQNKIVWTPADGNSIEAHWWPMTLTSCDIVDGGDVLHVSFAFTAANDLATSNVATPTGTAPAAFIVKNAIAGAMA